MHTAYKNTQRRSPPFTMHTHLGGGGGGRRANQYQQYREKNCKTKPPGSACFTNEKVVPQPEAQKNLFSF